MKATCVCVCKTHTWITACVCIIHRWWTLTAKQMVSLGMLWITTIPCALQVQLFHDELEICNPLGSKAKKHKLGKCTYCLLYCMDGTWLSWKLVQLSIYGTAQVQYRTCMHKLICSWLNSCWEKGMVLFSLTRIHPYKYFSNAHEKNGCHPLYFTMIQLWANRLVWASITWYRMYYCWPPIWIYKTEGYNLWKYRITIPVLLCPKPPIVIY